MEQNRAFGDLSEHYAAIARSWRSVLSGSVSSDFDRALAIRLMDRSREWGH
jgi:hypothetical protein